MDSKVLISIRELSQIIAKDGISISTSQEERLLTTVDSLSISPQIADRPKFQELQEDFLCGTVKEVNTLGTISEGE